MTKSREKGPEVDAERLRHTYEELKKMHIRLDPNPIEFGPKRFNHKIAETQSMLARLEQIFLQVSEDLHWFKRRLTVEKTVYEMERKELLANDMSVRSAPNQSLRDAVADSRLSDQIRSIQALELKAQDLEMLMVVIKAKRTDLKNSQGRLRDQLKLIEHDLGMGARWGNNAPPSPVAGAVADIDGLLATADEGGAWDDNEDEPEIGTEGVVVEDEDPTPHVDVDTLDLDEDGEDDDSEEIEEKEEEDDSILAEDDEAEPMPEASSSDDEVDAFLDSIDDAPEPDTGAPEVRDQTDIEDLISSLTE